MEDGWKKREGGGGGGGGGCPSRKDVTAAVEEGFKQR